MIPTTQRLLAILILTLLASAPTRPAIAQSREARIQAHEARMTEIIEESRRRRGAQPADQTTSALLPPSQFADTSVTRTASSQSREDRIRAHEARIQKIMEESRLRRAAQAAGLTTTSLLPSYLFVDTTATRTAPALSKNARIKEHQDRIQKIIEESRRYRAAKAAGQTTGSLLPSQSARTSGTRNLNVDTSNEDRSSKIRDGIEEERASRAGDSTSSLELRNKRHRERIQEIIDESQQRKLELQNQTTSTK